VSYGKSTYILLKKWLTKATRATELYSNQGEELIIIFD